jgi:redox-sensitive bicupin YhaK (pirin superfamily)
MGVRLYVSSVRGVRRVSKSSPTIEGAGVRLKRAFGPAEVHLLDPFLMLDDFHSGNPDDYIAGFPWHPHRGMETVTYLIRGVVEHEDSTGNKGVINSGDVQWMTAGSGILHHEMPKEYKGLMQGFQLWVNLPASRKMMSPRYREIKKEQIPTFSANGDVKAKIIAGQIDGVKGPVEDLVVEVEYLDVSILPNKDFRHSVARGNNAFAYVFEGGGSFDQQHTNTVKAEHLVIFTDGDEVKVRADESGVRFLLVSGRPIAEPVAWGGPIVMNTQEELDIAFAELQKGEFIRSH